MENVWIISQDFKINVCKFAKHTCKIWEVSSGIFLFYYVNGQNQLKHKMYGDLSTFI